MSKLPILTLVVTAAMAGTPALAATCPAPRFTVSDLKIGDGKLDRGWIGGVSLADVDSDGDLDLYATHGYDTSPNPPKPPRPDRSMLYLNDGRGAFSRAEANALSNADHYTSGSTFADVDDDGDLDAFVSTQVGKEDVFYRNLGKGAFRKEPLGAATATKGSNFTSSWADIDADGDLDLLSGGPTLEPGAPMQPYRNDAGQFVAVPDTAIANGKNNAGAVLFADLDNDGDLDLFVTNSDIQRNSGMDPAPMEHPAVYRNDGGWRFERVAGQPFDTRAYSSAGAALGDFDGDGVFDVFFGAQVFDKTPPGRDHLFRGLGGGRFEEVKGFDATLHPEWSTGAVFADFDLDGELDLMTVAYKDQIKLYMNDGKGGLARVPVPALDGRVKTHSGLVVGDIDRDGDLDAVSGDWGQAAGGEFISIIRNDTPRCGDWVDILPMSRAGAPNPTGTRITLVTRTNGREERRQLREASAQTSFRSQGAGFFHYGVGRRESVVRAEVRWPDGRTQTLPAPRRNARLVLKEPEQ